MRLIVSAKEQWAMNNGMEAGAAVDVPKVNEYLKGGTTPVCPQGAITSTIRLAKNLNAPFMASCRKQMNG